MSQYIKACENAARLGGTVLRDWRGRFRHREKAPGDLVTDADLASQTAIRQFLLRTYPDHAFLGEEEEGHENAHGAPDAQYRWIVDPLDGTTNYVHDLPGWCVSVALEHGGNVLVGCVYDPIAENCFTSIAGEGAYCNGIPLQTSNVTQLDAALVAISLPPQIGPDSPEMRRFLSVAEQSQAFRRLGSAAMNMCYLAAGKLDAYWATSVHSWDVAAGYLMVVEAGGKVTGMSGEPFDVARPRLCAAGSSALHQQLLLALAQPG